MIKAAGKERLDLIKDLFLVPDEGKVVDTVELDELAVRDPRGDIPAFFDVQAEIAGATIRRVTRRAKTVLLHLEDGRVMTVALRMTGALLVTEAGAPPDPYVRVTFGPKGGSGSKCMPAPCGP